MCHRTSSDEDKNRSAHVISSRLPAWPEPDHSWLPSASSPLPACLAEVTTLSRGCEVPGPLCRAGSTQTGQRSYHAQRPQTLAPITDPVHEALALPYPHRGPCSPAPQGEPNSKDRLFPGPGAQQRQAETPSSQEGMCL